MHPVPRPEKSENSNQAQGRRSRPERWPMLQLAAALLTLPLTLLLGTVEFVRQARRLVGSDRNNASR